MASGEDGGGRRQTRHEEARSMLYVGRVSVSLLEPLWPSPHVFIPLGSGHIAGILEDATICAPGGVRRQPEMSEAELEAAIQAQAIVVRKLKEVDGLTNSDPPVAEGVAELKRYAGKSRSLFARHGLIASRRAQAQKAS